MALGAVTNNFTTNYSANNYTKVSITTSFTKQATEKSNIYHNINI